MNVRRIMDERELTITEVAEEAGTSRPGLSRILSGEDGVTITRAERIAFVLDVKLTELLTPHSVQKNVRKTVDVPEAVR